MKKKIAIITDAIDDGGAGIGTYVENLVNGLGNEFDYYLVHHKKSDFYRGKKHIIVKIPNIPFGREIRKLLLMPLVLNKHKFDAVHETTQIGPFLFGKYKKILTIHDLAAIRVPKTFKLSTVIHHKLMLPLVLKNVDKIIAISEATKQDIIELYKVPKDKIDVIYQAAKSDLFRVTKFDGKALRKKYNLPDKYLLFVSTIEPRKNLINILRAYRKIKEWGFEHKLVLVGKFGWKYKKFLRELKKLDLANNIIFLGFIEAVDLPKIYTTATMLLFPSLYEGFGHPILEAMACGTPALV